MCARFGYVDLANADDVDKATALSGQELEGNEISVERAKARSFEPKQQQQQQQQQRTTPQQGGRQDRDTSGESLTESVLNVHFLASILSWPECEAGILSEFYVMFFSPKFLFCTRFPGSI